MSTIIRQCHIMAPQFSIEDVNIVPQLGYWDNRPAFCIFGCSFFWLSDNLNSICGLQKISPGFGFDRYDYDNVKSIADPFEHFKDFLIDAQEEFVKPEVDSTPAPADALLTMLLVEKIIHWKERSVAKSALRLFKMLLSSTTFRHQTHTIVKT